MPSPSVAHALLLVTLCHTCASTRLDNEKAAVKSAHEEAALASCPCDSWFGSSAETCCVRTDGGELNWDDSTDKKTCKPVPANADTCGSFCDRKCGDVPHKDDHLKFHEYLIEKATELNKMGTADYYLALAAFKARTVWDSVAPTNIRVKGVHPLHPVGSWRPDTWNKTLGRKNAVLAAKENILKNGGAVTQEAINTMEELRPMRSVSNFIAVPFPFCGYNHVLFEGNGRMKGMLLAAEEDPELQDMSVEVDLQSYTPQNLVWVQRSIARLWAEYVKEAMELNPETDGGQVKEYMTFKVGIVRCLGWDLFNGKCPIVSRLGAVPEPPKPQIGGPDQSESTLRFLMEGELAGVSRAIVVGTDATRRWAAQKGLGATKQMPLQYFELCDSHDGQKQYLVANMDGEVVKEYCPECIDRGL